MKHLAIILCALSFALPASANLLNFDQALYRMDRDAFTASCNAEGGYVIDRKSDVDALHCNLPGLDMTVTAQFPSARRGKTRLVGHTYSRRSSRDTYVLALETFGRVDKTARDKGCTSWLWRDIDAAKLHIALPRNERASLLIRACSDHYQVFLGSQ